MSVIKLRVRPCENSYVRNDCRSLLQRGFSVVSLWWAGQVIGPICYRKLPLPYESSTHIDILFKHQKHAIFRGPVVCSDKWIWPVLTMVPSVAEIKVVTH